MHEITPRQIEILKLIIAEYTETSNPVGSEIIDKKYKLGISPATVRNEMVELAKKGYLKKSHFSSGRVPTAMGFRYYIRNLMTEKELSTAEEVSYKSDIWDYREEIHALLQNATRVLAKRTNMLAAATTNFGDVYYHGVKNLLRQKEFYDVEVACGLLEQLDETNFFKGILNEFQKLEQEILFMLGEDEDKSSNNEYASIFGEFSGKKISGAIGVMGPKRMRYDIVIPNVKYFTNLIESIIIEQGL